MRRIILLAILIAAGGCQSVETDRRAQSDCEAPPSNEDRGLAADLDPVVAAAATRGFAGQIAIMRRGEIVYSRAAGSADLNGTTPVTDATLFHVASLTKYFTAALSLVAVDEGRLTLDARASELFPGTRIAERDFTAADLLSHRSGLRSTYAAESETDPVLAVAAIAEANRDNARDGDFHYANDGYDLLAIALERRFARSFETLVREKLASRACLRNIGFWGEAALNDPSVRGQPLRPTATDLDRRNYGMLGSAGLLITARDLVVWQSALRRGRILSNASLHELYAPRASTSLGQALFGAFLIDSPKLGAAISARGAEDWGDNAYLNDYRDCGYQIAVVTSRGPAEDSGEPLFRDSLTRSIEDALAGRCAKEP